MTCNVKNCDKQTHMIVQGRSNETHKIARIELCKKHFEEVDSLMTKEPDSEVRKSHFSDRRYLTDAQRLAAETALELDKRTIQ